MIINKKDHPKCLLRTENIRVTQITLCSNWQQTLHFWCIGIVKHVFLNLNKVLRNRSISLEEIKLVLNSNISSPILQWMKGRFDAMDVWLYRRLFIIEIARHMGKEEFLKGIRKKRPLVLRIRNRQLKTVGYKHGGRWKAWINWQSYGKSKAKEKHPIYFNAMA